VIIPADPETPAMLSADSTTTEESEKLAWIRSQLAYLITKAGRDYELYGDILLEELPPSVSPDDFLQLLESEHWYEQLCMLNPNVSDHHEWFQELRDYVVQELRSIRDEAHEAETHAARTTAIITPIKHPDLVLASKHYITGETDE
jgi:hypothetical protein